MNKEKTIPIPTKKEKSLSLLYKPLSYYHCMYRYYYYCLPGLESMLNLYLSELSKVLAMVTSQQTLRHT